MDRPEQRTLRRLAALGCLMAVIVIGMGAFTRLVDAGLGCPDWPGCYGHLLWPDEAHEVARANEAWPDAPVEHDKTWPEMVHRYLASALGLLAIAIAVVAWRHRGSGLPVKLPLALLAFIIVQGLFGMWTVTLKLWPQVVTAHLLGGFTTFSLFWILWLRLRPPVEGATPLPSLQPLAMAALLMLVIQIALGGWTTSNYAAVACPDLPTCQNQWWPPMDFAAGFDLTQDIGPNYLGGTMDNDARVAIHMSHRLGAIFTTLLLSVLAVALWRQERAYWQRMAWFVAGGLSLQVALGLSNILFHFPVAVAVAHNIGGALLLLLLITVNYRLLIKRAQ